VSELESIYAGSLDCVHCGLCLTSCPTYLATGKETSSPRGRVYLMRGVAEGKVELAGLLSDEAHLCLGCRACETACPAGVPYGAMLEDTRAALQEAGLRSTRAARLERWLLRNVVARRERLHWLVSLLALAQRLRLDRLAAVLLPESLRDAHALMPRIPAASQRAALPELTRAKGERRGRVAFFTGCMMSEVFGPVQQASVRVLAANGFDVVVPREQGCCGALHAHAGDMDFARGLARHNANVFRREAQVQGADQAEPFDAIILDSAGCGAAMREADRWIPGEGDALASRVRDVCEFLDEVGLREPTLLVEARVCYDDPCHLVHGQGVEAAPRRLLAQVPGLELVAHANPTRCCGAAGTYNLTHPDMARTVLADKMDALEAAHPDVIATGNPGCLMQIGGGVRERDLRARVQHPIELLDAAYEHDVPSL
jgi:glycolate oxidase iron-sulfur subunit